MYNGGVCLVVHAVDVIACVMCGVLVEGVVGGRRLSYRLNCGAGSGYLWTRVVGV